MNTSNTAVAPFTKNMILAAVEAYGGALARARSCSHEGDIEGFEEAMRVAAHRFAIIERELGNVRAA
jgi:hypothetical protein